MGISRESWRKLREKLETIGGFSKVGGMLEDWNGF
jgi:hypothetical protein